MTSNTGDFDNKVALITGGTSGVGFKVAKRLAHAGASVVVNGRNPQHGEDAVTELRSLSERVHFVAGDCTDYASVTRVVDEARRYAGGIDILVTAGAEGQGSLKPFAEMSADELRSGFDTRFLPRIFPVHAALPALRERGGSVVMLTTDAGRHVTPGESIIGAVGAATMLMIKALAKEFAQYRIRVNGVAMTITSDTPSWDRIFSVPGFQRDVFTKAVERFPFGRPPSADEVASVVVLLVSDATVQVTGQTVSVNGGLSFGGW
jgi:3-oxoacyl-[acyl-carrier protein] reductase